MPLNIYFFTVARNAIFIFAGWKRTRQTNSDLTGNMQFDYYRGLQLLSFHNSTVINDQLKCLHEISTPFFFTLILVNLVYNHLIRIDLVDTHLMFSLMCIP